MSITVIVHKHHQFLASETGKVGIPLFAVKIPEFKGHIVIVACTVSGHRIKHIAEKNSLVPSRPFMRIVQNFEEFLKAGSFKHSDIILQLVFHFYYLQIPRFNTFYNITFFAFPP